MRMDSNISLFQRLKPDRKSKFQSKIQTPTQLSYWGVVIQTAFNFLTKGKFGVGFAFCFIILLIIFSISNLSSTPLPPSKTNIAVTDSLLRSYITKTVDFLKEKNIQTINFINNRTDESRYIEQLILAECKNKGIALTSQNADSAIYNLRITIKELKIRYINHEASDDSLNREIIVDLSGMLLNSKTGIIEQGPVLTVFYKDLVSRNDLDFIKNYEFKFANPDVPEKPGSWFRDIAQPIIIIAAAATTILLLFTVRSK